MSFNIYKVYFLSVFQFLPYRSYTYFVRFILKYSLVAQTVKHLSTMWEASVRSLGREDPLEKEMAIYSSTLAWKIPWTEEPSRLQSMGSQIVGHNCATSLILILFWRASQVALVAKNLPANA